MNSPINQGLFYDIGFASGNTVERLVQTQVHDLETQTFQLPVHPEKTSVMPPSPPQTSQKTKNIKIMA